MSAIAEQPYTPAGLQIKWLLADTDAMFDAATAALRTHRIGADRAELLAEAVLQAAGPHLMAMVAEMLADACRVRAGEVESMGMRLGLEDAADLAGQFCDGLNLAYASQAITDDE